jgi:SAM-dependent methyltransferase
MKDQPGSLDPQFDRFAEDYDAALNRGLSVSGEAKEFFAEGRLRWLRHRLDKLGAESERALDFGCGTGTSGSLLISLCGLQNVLGVEVSSKSIEVARRIHPDPRLTFGLIEECKPRADFDLAFCNGVFHHVPPANRPACVEYVFRSLRPGGCFAFFENNPWNPGTQIVMSRIPFDRDAIKLSPLSSGGMLRAGGFEIVTTDFLFFFPKQLAWFRRIESHLCKLPLGAQYLVLARKPTTPPTVRQVVPSP